MGRFASDTKNRAWVGTVHVANMRLSGLKEEEYENPEHLARFLVGTWEKSRKGRTAGVSVCVSATGCYHAHLALYGNLTTLKNASKIMFNSHIEPQLGGKKELKSYLLKEPPYDESGEKVLYTMGLESIRDNKGKRSDLEEISDLLEEGLTPAEIMEENFSYRRYEKMIKSAYVEKRIKQTPLLKDMRVEWHVGESGTGKTYTYYKMAQEHSPENIYLLTDFKNGGLDFYIDAGAPPILFIDEFKGEDMPFGQLLIMLDKYSRSQTHCRYSNTYNLWETCVITSIYPPDEVYSFMVENNRQNRDKKEQLLRRLDVIVYHYIENHEYKTFSIPVNEYVDYEDLKRRALNLPEGFIPMEQQVPFKNEDD